jgi:lipoate-protein ligase A
MNVPTEKIYDKGYSCFSERITSIQRELDRPVSEDEVMQAIRRSYEEEFQVEFIPDELTPWERNKVQELKTERYTNPAWIFSHKHPRSQMAEALKKTRGGLLQIYLSLAGSIIDQIVITGDFFSTTAGINRIESVLKWSPAVRNLILANLESVWEEGVIYGVEMGELADAIMQAKNKFAASSR